MNAITSMAWIPCGCAKSKPDKIRISMNDIQTANFNDEDESLDSDREQPVKKRKNLPKSQEDSQNDSHEQTHDEDITRKYDMEDYEEEEEEDNSKNVLSIENIVSLSDEAKDPYIGEQADSDSDEDDEILPTDSLLLVGKTHGEYNTLEVHVYTSDKDIYCHHDYILSSVPLAITWLDFDPGEDQQGNIAAIGYMSADIDLWDLDVMNAVEPILTLPGSKKSKSSKKAKGNKNKRQKVATGHTDAVLALAWNKQQKNVLASASADSKILLWDLIEANMVTSLETHSDKVQAIAWHLDEPQTLLSGSADKSVVVCDCRDPSGVHKNWTVKSEIEQVAWNAKKPYVFHAGTSSGRIYTFDIRTDNPVSKIKAHDDAITGLGIGPNSDETTLLYSASVDKTVKLWDVSGDKPKLFSTRDGKVGKIFCAEANPDDSWKIAFGGEREFRIQYFKK